jgi:MFS family permease
MSFTSGSRWRDVYLASTARGISYTGEFLAATALLLTLQTKGYSGTAIAALLIASALPLVVFAPVAGRIVDRFDSRVILCSVGVVQAACCVLMASVSNPVVLIGLVALLATGLSVTSPTFSALLPDMVRIEDLPRATALGQTATSIGALAGPALAGVLVGQYGLRIPLLINAATYLAIAAVGLALRTRRNMAAQAGAEAGAPEAATAEPVRWRLSGDRILFPLIVLVGAAIAGAGLVGVAEVFFIRETIGASETVYGLVTAVWSASIMVGAWLFTKQRFDDGGLALALVGTLVAICLAFMALGQVRSLAWVVGLFVAGGIANGALNSAAGVIMARRVPAAVRGRAFATLVAVVNGGHMSAYLLSGFLLGWLAPETVITTAGIAGLAVVAALFLPLYRAIRRERRAVESVAPAPDHAAMSQAVAV